MTRSGLRSFGAYVPRLRLEREAIAAATGWASGLRGGKPNGRRSYCAWDEDSVTMAVEAARDCLVGHDRSTVSSLVFASTTHPFADRCNAGVVAEALDLNEAMHTSDAAGHQRAGVAALLEALRGVDAGNGPAVVVAAERRIARAGSEQESRFGHGAAAVLVTGGDDLAAELVGQASLRADFVDHYRGADGDYDYAYEERWVRDEGYLALVPRAIAAALERAGVATHEVAHCIVQGPQRFAQAVVKSAGLRAETVENDLHAACGDTGVAHPLLLLGGVLERAEPGALVLVAGFGQGCDVVVLRATGRRAAAGRGCSGALAGGVANREYVRFLANCGLVDVDWGMRAERDNRTAQSALWRHHRDVTAFVGGRCTRCGTVQYPRSRACVNPECRAFDTQVPERFADKVGRVKTYTEDWLAVTRSPPHVYGNVEFEGGGNAFIEFADTRPGELDVGTPVRFVFRVKDFDAVRGFHRYFWKAVPVRN
ncbi:MAG TPA: zinc ribbon domain-containing protein [Steroidobacteraceae bacterium]|nr:zinc ribbon domain-containing protein [Steroidobacteraceae bacterium]